MLVWCKTPHGIGLGGDFRLTMKSELYARRGSLPAMRICDTTWFNWPRSIHSRKPQEAYELIELMTLAPHHESDRLELFAREKRDGWTSWGDEINEGEGTSTTGLNGTELEAVEQRLRVQAKISASTATWQPSLRSSVDRSN